MRHPSVSANRSDPQWRPDVAPARLRLLASALAARMRIVEVAGLVVMLVLPLLGFSVAEADPYHEHILIGGTSAEQISALTHHLYHHIAAPWPTRSRQTGGVDLTEVTGSSCVVSVLSSSAAGSAVFALVGAGLVGTSRCVAPDTTFAGRVALMPSAFWWEVTLLTPDPPPRWS